jgi:hypothetical protein
MPDCAAIALREVEAGRVTRGFVEVMATVSFHVWFEVQADGGRRRRPVLVRIASGIEPGCWVCICTGPGAADCDRAPPTAEILA